MSDTTPAFADISAATRAEYWASLALRHTPGLGARSAARLMRTFGSAHAAYESTQDWDEAGIDKAKATALVSGAWRVPAQEEWTAAQKNNIRILLWNDTVYPERLRQLPDAPLILYYAGDTALLHAPALAVVGSRACTSEGVRVAGNIVRQLSASGVTIISGMALGIDREAHTLAMQDVGRSIGVLGTGLDIVYPAKNADIFTLLRTQGLLLTEFAPGTPPLPGHFPIRNRIISGLALGVLVVEATLRSGSLITARLANEQDREVYAIPGPASVAASLGCQELIRQGARPVFNADDILRDLAPQLAHFGIEEKKHLSYNSPASLQAQAPAQSSAQIQGQRQDQTQGIAPIPPVLSPTLPKSEEAQRIFAALQAHDSCHTDTLCMETGLPVACVNTTLVELEVLGCVQRLPGARYRVMK